jgi:hypothetical protein
MWSWRRSQLGLLACAWWVLVSTGCREETSPIVIDPETSGSTTGSNASASITSTTAATASSTSAIDDSDADTRGVTTVPFLLEPDTPGPMYECDIFEQDCRPGEKCTVWASGGGVLPNASRCVPVVDDPVGTSEPCHVQDTPLSGLDDCELGDYCWEVDPKTLEGVCVAFCVGDVSNPQCEDPSLECTICGDSCLPLCLPMCSPVAQDCPEGSACYPNQHAWYCAPDASGELGGYGDPCEYVNVCDPGLLCLESSVVPACEGPIGCCTEICDITDPTGDLQCAGAAEGQICQPWYEDGAAPPGYENVGVCALPP